MHRLTVLAVGGTGIKPDDLIKLKSVLHLHQLNLVGTRVSRHEVDTLKRALPGCYIIATP